MTEEGVLRTFPRFVMRQSGSPSSMLARAWKATVDQRIPGATTALLSVLDPLAGKQSWHGSCAPYRACLESMFLPTQLFVKARCVVLHVWQAHLRSRTLVTVA